MKITVFIGRTVSGITGFSFAVGLVIGITLGTVFYVREVICSTKGCVGRAKTVVVAAWLSRCSFCCIGYHLCYRLPFISHT